MAHLSVYKASAGSGKTYTLAFEYLLHLIRNPYAYRRILAVTFTNKATNEMKSRIVEELYNLATDRPTPYLQPLAEKSGFPNKEIQVKSKLAFDLLMHDYSRFSVETIDKFFHKVLQSFTREIGLQSGFNLELDIMKIMADSIDEMLFHLPENEPLLHWLVHLAEAKIEVGKSWNYKYDLLTTGGEIFKEKFKLFGKQLIEKLSNKQFLNKQVTNLKKINLRFEKTLQELGKQGLDLMEQNGLEIRDFNYGHGGFANHFRKLADKKDFMPGIRTRKAAGDVSSWSSGKTDKKESITRVYEEGLNKILTDSIRFYDDHAEEYNTSVAIYRNIFSLGILIDLQKQVMDYCNEKNLFLISEMSGLLKEIIEGNDAPFIYEKAGNIFHHFMIDEFQDTSQMQWQNFRPLILNSLAQNNDCMIVGDVKQSIYRWRNSDWKILSEQLQIDFQDPWINSYPLNINWRSKENIVRFNNLFFREAALMLENHFIDSQDVQVSDPEKIKNLAGKITNAYEDTIQEIAKTKHKEGGFVRLKIYGNEEKDWKEKVKKELPGLINDLLEKGYKPGDITILVRDKKDGRDIVTSILNPESPGMKQGKPKFDILSNESLYLENSRAVLLIISVLKYLLDKNDRINSVFMLAEYNRFFNRDRISPLGYLEALSADPETIDDLIKESFPEEFTESIPLLSHLPLYELVEHVIKSLKINHFVSEMVFIQALLDVIMEFSQSEASDLRSFLEFWKVEGAGKTINAAEEQDAVRVLTIHKAKGLEFPVVIIPYCNWTMDHNPSHQNIIWCQPVREPFNTLDLVPVNYSSKLEGTIFRDDYYTEKLHAYVDNLNLLYVAFTRAIENLYIYSPIGSKGMRHSGDLINNVIQNKMVASEIQDRESSQIMDSARWNNESGELSIGMDSDRGEDVKRELIPSGINAEHPVSLPGDRLRLALHKSDYFILDDQSRQASINEGNLMHELFEFIRTADDIDKAVDRLVIRGKISEEEKEKLKNSVYEKVTDPLVKEWFDKKWSVKAESDILIKNEKVRRPDRVMIMGEKAIVVDYKFGEVEEDSYKYQLRKYIKLLKEMGYRDVSGFIWYVKLKKIIEVVL